MGTLKTIDEATTLFNTYFTNGANRNTSLTQITDPRTKVLLASSTVEEDKTKAETAAMRLGEQLQFLGALHKKTTNTTVKANVAKEIDLVLTTLNSKGFLSGSDARAGGNWLNESFILMGLTIVRSGTAYAAITNKSLVDSGLTNLSNQLETALEKAWTEGQWSEAQRGGTTTHTDAKSGVKVQSPLMSLNSTFVGIGALGLYQNMYLKGTKYNNLINKYVAFVRTVGNISGSKAFYTIGGGRAIERRIFGSSGYNALVAQAFMLAYRGVTLKDLTVDAPTTNGTHQAGILIGNYYGALMDKENPEKLHEIHFENGVKPTAQEISTAAANSGAWTKHTNATTAEANLTSSLNLLGPGHDQASCYLYSLAWGAPASYFAKLDKHIMYTVESRKLTNVSAMRSAINNTTTKDANSAATGRILGAFAAFMLRGIDTVTDGQ